MELSTYKDFAINLACRAAELGLSFLGKARTSIKEDSSPVTEADCKVQQFITESIRSAFPDHNIIAEEQSCVERRDNSHLVWVVDPIDGTRNFARSFPLFATSIALLEGREVILGVIRVPCFDWTFYADSDQVAELNGRPISVSDVEFSHSSIIALTLESNRPLPIGIHKLINSVVVRDFGSVAIHTAMVAAGMLDGAIGLSPCRLWDIAAGSIILKKAGGIISAIEGELIPQDFYELKPIPFYAGGRRVALKLEEFLRSSS